MEPPARRRFGPDPAAPSARESAPSPAGPDHVRRSARHRCGRVPFRAGALAFGPPSEHRHPSPSAAAACSGPCGGPAPAHPGLSAARSRRPDPPSGLETFWARPRGPTGSGLTSFARWCVTQASRTQASRGPGESRGSDAGDTGRAAPAVRARSSGRGHARSRRSSPSPWVAAGSRSPPTCLAPAIRARRGSPARALASASPATLLGAPRCRPLHGLPWTPGVYPSWNPMPTVIRGATLLRGRARPPFAQAEALGLRPGDARRSCAKCGSGWRVAPRALLCGLLRCWWARWRSGRAGLGRRRHLLTDPTRRSRGGRARASPLFGVGIAPAPCRRGPIEIRVGGWRPVSAASRAGYVLPTTKCRTAAEGRAQNRGYLPLRTRIAAQVSGATEDRPAVVHVGRNRGRDLVSSLPAPRDGYASVAVVSGRHVPTACQRAGLPSGFNGAARHQR